MIRKASLSAAVYLGVVFLSGALVGAFAYRLYTVNTVKSSSIPRSPEEHRRRAIAEMTRRLHLSPDQVTRVEQIMEETRLRFEDLRERQKPALKAAEMEHHDKIRAILDPSQKLEYEKMREERERRRQELQKNPKP